MMKKGQKLLDNNVSRLEGSSLDLQLNGKLGRRVRIQLRQKKIKLSALQKVVSFSICS